MTVSIASPLEFGGLTLKNRVLLASLTRDRNPATVPGELNIEYYRQRSTAGLILSEGILVEPLGTEWTYAPGIYSEKQIAGWKKVTDTVHVEGSLIFAQLWHVGRVSHPVLQAGQPNVGPSARCEGWQIPPAHQAIEDPQRYIDLYRIAAQNAKRAGFDGVEIHAANGYLPYQLLDKTANQRTDKWGGSDENRTRFAIEAVKGAIEGFSDARRVGIKLSPSGGYNDVGDAEDVLIHTYSHLITEIEELNIGYIQLVRWFAAFDPTTRGNPLDPIKHFRPLIKNAKVFLNGELTGTEAAELVALGQIDAAVFGRPFIANPDLPHRIIKNLPLADINWGALYRPAGD
ncbi:hypothetical protein BDK51DRAFT_35949 [Blyttiomyces helicus]|uniref:NADH:flavin oxidoreductase/NADH oxidase N-terminal domain-containing protein n=1 Tax=Blyttiomyces helicus TaxID=388810 RepID=A0A4P9WD93_9FUNG|nr:hypothetical protein BDK51DRAFT_35949 [Blyttiomyces helicus]|eukprot:RKO89613.1 hypothetical protein BDK51DRAFT_35949 [Blyttiomyces helicus]